MIAVAWVAARFASPQLIAALFAATVVYCWRARDILASFWNPHVSIMPTIALTVVCAAIAAGEVTLIPLAVTLGSFIAQTYIGLLPYAVGLCLDSHHRRYCDLSSRPRRLDRPEDRRVLQLTVWLLIMLWSGPLAEQMTHSPGNLTRLFHFFREAEGTPGTTEASSRGQTTSPGPCCLGSGSTVAVPSPRALQRGRSLYSALVAVLLVPASLVFRAKRHRFDAAFAAHLLVALVIGFWSTSRIVGLIPAYGIVWISGDWRVRGMHAVCGRHHLFHEGVWMAIPSRLGGERDLRRFRCGVRDDRLAAT